MVCAMLIPQVAFGQNQRVTQKFDVTSVKPTPKERLDQPQDLECHNGRLITRGFPVSFLIGWSYQVNDARMVGLPGWARDWESAYDIEAKAAIAVSQQQCRLMARTLLAERFGLTAHQELRRTKGYSLVTVDHGAKLAKFVVTSLAISAKINRQTVRDTPGIEGLSMSSLASILGGHPAVGFLPVADRTGLPGRYSLNLTFSTRDDDERSSVFTALKDQLGLKLESAELPVEFLVVDRIEKPDAN